MNILTLQEIARIAPSALATRAKPGLSARYAFLSTAEAIRIHGDQGWLPVSARQARTRIPGYDGFTRHEIVFRRLTDKPALELGEVIPELRLVNSHAGQCSYQIHAGLMRLVCRNGLVAPTSAAGRLRVRHTVQEVQELADRLKDVSARLPKLMEVVHGWRKIPLQPDQASRLAATGLRLRYGDRQDRWPATPEAVALTMRRLEDQGDDLWTTFNRIQENVIQGGPEVPGKIDERRRHRRRIRRLGSIAAGIRINQGLWEAAETLALAS